MGGFGLNSSFISYCICEHLSFKFLRCKIVLKATQVVTVIIKYVNI